MGAVRMSVQTAVKNLTIIHKKTTRLQLTPLKHFNIKMSLLDKINSIIHNNAYPNEKVV